MPTVYVAAGSNFDPVSHLRAAAVALERSFGTLRRSATYRSEAVGLPAPDYLNMVFVFETGREADAVKSELIAIEAAAGRLRGEPRAALCSLDLDLLIHGERIDAQRRLPHPDVLRRAFVLAPLAELAPGLAHPVTGERLEAARDRLAVCAPPVVNAGNLETIG